MKHLNHEPLLDWQGLNICSRYAYPPNALHYCGPEKQNDLKSYIAENVTDQGLPEIISQFETLFPYLRLIASANHIKDIFDRRVVEAYWIGNSLLDRVKSNDYVRHAKDSIKLPKLLKKPNSQVYDQIASGFPFHTFHVLNIFMRTGHHASPQTHETMDSCRVSWGEVLMQKNAEEYLVEVFPLVKVEDQLRLGDKHKIIVKSMNIKPKTGDYVSLHWSTICQILTKPELNSLIKYTHLALQIHNNFS